MGIFFPDNEKRRLRLLQLSSDTQQYLTDAKKFYKKFVELNGIANQKIAAVYAKANLNGPAISQVDILAAQSSLIGKSIAETSVQVSNLLLGVGGLALSVSYFAPAATALLVDVGILEAEVASAVLFSALGVEFTVGLLAGGVIAGVLVGVALVGIGLAIDAIEGLILRDHLRKGIYQNCEFRVLTRYSLDKSKVLVEQLQAIIDSCEAYLQSDIALTDQLIQNLIKTSAAPSLKKMEAITKNSVLAELKSFDAGRDSWCDEDEDGKDIKIDDSSAVYINASVNLTAASCPKIPGDLKLSGSPTGKYPVLKINGVQFWSFSYADDRYGIAIVGFDKQGKLVKRLDKLGVKHTYKIDEDAVTGNVVFIGEDDRKLVVSWEDLVGKERARSRYQKFSISHLKTGKALGYLGSYNNYLYVYDKESDASEVMWSFYGGELFLEEGANPDGYASYWSTYAARWRAWGGARGVIYNDDGTVALKEDPSRKLGIQNGYLYWLEANSEDLVTLMAQ